MTNLPGEEPPLRWILEHLGSREPNEAWAAFLEAYSPIIQQVVLLFEREPDHRADCFLFVCEQLSQRQFRRLRRFNPEGKAQFTTWLQVVVRNLCLDWRRKEFGRQRVFQSVTRLSALDQEVFRATFVHGLSPEECFSTLHISYPSLTRQGTDESLGRIRQALTPRQFRLLATRFPKLESLKDELPNGQAAPQRQIPDPRPDPEAQSAMREQQGALERALARLPEPERLLVRLRFDQGLTLQEIAQLTGWKDAQTADRRIREVLEKLRRELS